MKLIRNFISSVKSLKDIPLKSILKSSKVSTLYKQNRDDKLVKLLSYKGTKYYKEIKFMENSDYSLLHQIVFDNRKDLFNKLVTSLPFIINKEILDNQSNKLSLSPLQLAAITDNVYFFESLIDLGADISVSNINHMNLLHLAAYNGSVKVINLLINKYKLDINSKTRDKQTPLHVACFFGKIDISNLLLEANAKLYEKEEGGLTPIEFCCLGDHNVLFKILKEHYYSEEKLIEINKENPKYLSLIHLAATSKAGTKILAELAKDQTIINSVCDKYKSTPLHFSVLENNLLATEILLREGAFINAKDYLGNTPLHYATEIGNIKLIRVLFSYGADVNIKNENGLSPFNIANTQDNKEVQLFYASNSTTRTNTSIITEEDFLFKKLNRLL